MLEEVGIKETLVGVYHYKKTLPVDKHALSQYPANSKNVQGSNTGQIEIFFWISGKIHINNSCPDFEIWQHESNRLRASRSGGDLL